MKKRKIPKALKKAHRHDDEDALSVPKRLAAKVNSIRLKRDKSLEQRMLTDMRLFYRNTDWAALWEEFYTAVTITGARKYSLRRFINKMGESDEQIDFLWWYFGAPLLDDDPDKDKYPFVVGGPQDWLRKRENGGWFTPKNIAEFRSDITRQVNALDAVASMGNRATIGFVHRGHKMAVQLDEEFRGQFFRPDYDAAQNATRAHLYMSLHERILTYQERAQSLYAKCHGIDFADMSGIVTLMSAVGMRGAQAEIDGKAQGKDATMITEIVKMAMHKAAQYKMDVPVDVEAKVMEVNDAPEAKPTKKKPN